MVRAPRQTILFHCWQRAFTIVEILIVVVILGVLAALALPSLLGFIQSNRVRSTTSEFISSLDYAKGEAITRGYPVSICPLVDSTVPTECGTDWSQGWMVFVNEGNATAPSSDDDRLRVVDDISDSLIFSTSVTLISFQSSGFPDPGDGIITITPTNCLSNNQRELDISRTGRVDVEAQSCPSSP